MFLFFFIFSSFCEDDMDMFDAAYEEVNHPDDCLTFDFKNAILADVLVIGSGPAGNTAAMYAAKAGLKTYVYSGETPGGQLTTTGGVENFPTFKGTGKELVESIKSQAESSGAIYKFDTIFYVDFSVYPRQIMSENGESILAKSVIIATGAKPRLLGLDSESRLLGKGVSTCAHCDGSLFKGKSVVIVGGGNSASYEALYLKNICSNVTILTRGPVLRSSKVLQEELKSKGINIVTNAQVTNITGYFSVTGIKYTNTVDNTNHTICCKGVFIAIGQTPATSVFEKQLKLNKDGQIITDQSTRTNVDGVFAAGDCSDNKFKQAIVASADGCKAAMLAIEYVNKQDASK